MRNQEGESERKNRQSIHSPSRGGALPLVWLLSQLDGFSFSNRCFRDSGCAPGTVLGSGDPGSKTLEKGQRPFCVGAPCAQDTLA